MTYFYICNYGYLSNNLILPIWKIPLATSFYWPLEDNYCILLSSLFHDIAGKNNQLLSSNDIICEIQIRTKIQDVFGDLTHEFHYKDGQDFSKAFKKIEEILANQANRLALEDNSFMILRDIFMEANKNNGSGNEGITLVKP